MARIARRRVLTLSASGGMAAILASGRAPALAQETSVHWLRWADFVPASDVLLKGPITQECKKATGITLKVETVNANDLQSRITSAIQSGTGADIIMALEQLAAALRREPGRRRATWPRRSARPRAATTTIARQIATVGNKWIGVPWTIGGGLIAYRKSWLEEAGYNDLPRDLGHLPRGRQEAEGQGAADRPDRRATRSATRRAGGIPILWSWGGKEVEADGKTVVLNSKETVESIKFAVALWKETMDEGGLAWDDTNNNRAFLSQTVSATNNGASIYIEAKKKPDTYKTEKGTPMWQDILHAAHSQGAGRPVQLAGPVHRHADGLLEEPEGGQGLPALDPLQAGLRPVVRLAAGLHLRRHQGVGEARGVGRRSGAEAVPRPAVDSAGWPATPGRPTARPPR